MKKNKQKETASERLKEILAVLRRHSIIHGVTPEKLRLILEELGPTYVKLGQIMSMRSDILPQNYCNELMRLRAEVKPVPFVEVIQLIEKQYHRPIQEVFPVIEEKPLGSASIAQVHRVTLKDGRQAVIKVQRPNIKETMSEDIALMRKAAKLLKKIEISGDAIDFLAVIEELWIISQQEMDFLLEARNCQELTELNADIEYVTFPIVEQQLTTSKILVMEYVEGIPIDQIEQLTELGYDMNEIGLKLADNYIKQALDDGFFHGDPHPGNIWIREGKIVFLDLGMVGKLNVRDRSLFKAAVQAIVDEDVFALKDVVLALGTAKGKINHAQLHANVEYFLNKYRELDFGSMDMGEFIRELLDICNQNNLETPSRITLLARGVVTLEGVLRACCPDVNFMQIAANHMKKEFFEDFDPIEKTKKLGKSVVTSSRKAVEIPAQISDLLKMTIKGQTKMNLDVTGAEEPIRQLDHMLDKLIICLISSSLLIGSSLISTTNMVPKIFNIPLFGVLGFCASGLLGSWLLFGILKSWYKKR